ESSGLPWGISSSLELAVGDKEASSGEIGQMHLAAIKVLCCPECFRPFADISSALDPIEFGTLRCSNGHEFPFSGGIPMFVRESDRHSVAMFADSYAKTWGQNGWGTPSPAYLMSLPYRDL